MPDREILETDVLIVGAGPAGLACAIALSAADSTGPGAAARPNVLILEKGVTVGAHILSGCLLDPCALDELLPEWRECGAPVRQEVTATEWVWLTPARRRALPPVAVPSYLGNDGMYLVHLGELTEWLSREARRRGVEILEGVSAAELLLEGRTVRGVRCADTGRRRDGTPGPDFVPGAEVRARITVLAEGVRGSLTRELIRKLGLDAGRWPQVYGLGLKEIWETRPGAFPAGGVLNTLGYPLGEREAFGGGFVYGMSATRVAAGIVAALDYADPALDPHAEFQRWKDHPAIRGILSGGRLLQFGAKALPEGGLDAVPALCADGAVLVGDAAGLLNPARLKGAHLALKSGREAGRRIGELLKRGQSLSRSALSPYEEHLLGSWAGEELRAFRHWRAAYRQSLVRGAFQDLLRLAGLEQPAGPPSRPDHATLKPLAKVRGGNAPASTPPDGQVTFDKTASLACSGTSHREDQPPHLAAPDPELCARKCAVEFGNPCQRFCPAAVYEWLPEGRLLIHAANCLHCKTCEIKDPYENLLWKAPEGGGGPRYRGM